MWLSFSFQEEVVGSPLELRSSGLQWWGVMGVEDGCQEGEIMGAAGVLEPTAAAVTVRTQVRWEAVAFVGGLLI